MEKNIDNIKLQTLLQEFNVEPAQQRLRLPFIMDNHGKILEILSTREQGLSASHITGFIKLLKKGQYIQDYFEVPDFENSTGKSFPLKQQYLNIFTDYHHYSILPIHFCTIQPFEDEKFAGLIYTSQVLPSTDYFENIGFYYNEKQELVSFNFPFFSLVGDYYKEPQAMLGRPLKDIFFETPEELATRGMKAMDAGPVDAANAVPLSLNPEVGDILLSHPELATVQSGSELNISNTLDDFTLVTYSQPVDYLSEKVTLRFQYQSGNGRPPVIMIGFRGFSDKNYLTPDQAGYGLSPSPDGNQLLFKKLGFLIASAPLAKSSSDKLHLLELTIGRRFLVYKIDNQTVLSFYNFIPFHGYQQYFNLGIRKGHEYRFSAMRIARTRVPEPAAARTSEVTLRLKAFPDRYFALTHVSNPILRDSSVKIRGLMMHEVTSLQKKVKYEQERGKQLLKRIRQQEGAKSQFIGSSLPVLKLMEHARTIAGTNYTVLIQGPTGSGKEVLAHYLHEKGSMPEGPFVKVDCSTIPQTLFESNVFGHVKGAFTGAHTDAPGLLEKANGGTAFIDEVQNLTLEAQAKMLQVMQDATITRVGGNTPIKLNVRFVVASNQLLEDLVRQGKFREDLFFRINVVTLNVPALARHKDDIPELCEHFIRQYNLESGKNIESLDPKCYPVLFEYDWPGSIRELRNVITHACIFGAGEVVSEEIIRQSISRHQAVQPAAPALSQGEEGYMGRITKSQLVQLLKKHHGRAARVAVEIGVARNSVYYNIRKFEINLGEFQV